MNEHERKTRQDHPNLTDLHAKLRPGGAQSAAQATSQRANTENSTFDTRASRIERSLAVVVEAAAESGRHIKSALARFAREWVHLGVGPDDSAEAVVIATAGLLVQHMGPTAEEVRPASMGMQWSQLDVERAASAADTLDVGKAITARERAEEPDKDSLLDPRLRSVMEHGWMGRDHREARAEVPDLPDALPACGHRDLHTGCDDCLPRMKKVATDIRGGAKVTSYPAVEGTQFSNDREIDVWGAGVKYGRAHPVIEDPPALGAASATTPPDGAPSWPDWLEERARAATGDMGAEHFHRLDEFYRGRARAFRDVAKAFSEARPTVGVERALTFKTLTAKDVAAGPYLVEVDDDGATWWSTRLPEPPDGATYNRRIQGAVEEGATEPDPDPPEEHGRDIVWGVDPVATFEALQPEDRSEPPPGLWPYFRANN